MQDAVSDGTRAKRKQFGVFLCLPMAAVLLLIWNGDFGMSPIYGHHRARYCSPSNGAHVGRRKLSAMGIAKLVANRKCLFRFHVSKADAVAIDGSIFVENAALPPKDICSNWYVRFVPKADITTSTEITLAAPGGRRFLAKPHR
jgi:hypothetical protein